MGRVEGKGNTMGGRCGAVENSEVGVEGWEEGGGPKFRSYGCL